MTATLAQIWRHPVKAIGREALDQVTLTPGAWLPGDRLWGVAHERSKLDGDGWAKKANFLRGVTDPALMAATCVMDDDTGFITMSHPKAGDVRFHPESDPQPFLDWVGGIWSAELPAPTGLYRASDAHLTDVPDAWISIAALSSNRALGQRMGQTLSPDRWRANLWLEGTAPWAEKEWVGETLRIGETILKVACEITRCKATMANPETGRRDADTLGALDALGHQEFGLYAEVIEGGTIRVGDPVETP
ncbi:MAG: MOSC domain-containing protein [Paracoccaceae bacterium]|nr:MOSC domain-containing protein [Paracoccaceae bacterium]